MATLTIRDESAAGRLLDEFPLEFPTERITVRELIRERIYQEVQDRERATQVRKAHSLVTPETIETVLNGCHREPPKPRAINWKRQVEVACDAFERNGFFILVDDRQAESLDDTVFVSRETTVSFVKLTPLVGG
ncbi:MAG: hypothetical protein H7Y17_13585 [Chlorobia bacterium]|nr:hypothetical protein [Fimbriimonadaceae bacterium]